jgi:hypothetical protein
MPLRLSALQRHWNGLPVKPGNDWEILLLGEQRTKT